MYNHNKIEKKWQKHWLENKTFRFVDNAQNPKCYVLDMFPYPSGKGLHVGHPKGYTATDVISRFKRLNGFDVLHPIGWDAFGLPAEQYALETNNHPRDFTSHNIEVFRKQLQMLGFDYDYDKEVNTTDPQFYMWTQWIFIQLYKHDLAEIKDIDVNWCPKLGTVLSNEEIVYDDQNQPVSERGKYPVFKKPMKQWVLKISAYAERLLENLKDLDFSSSLKALQTNWIGRSEGYSVDFVLEQTNTTLPVFTTRLDTIYGVSFVGMAYDHLQVNDLLIPQSRQKAVKEFLEQVKNTSDRQRLANQEKNGVFTGLYVINPINNEKVPLFLVDYVLSSFATGIVMGVPAHDDRDFLFAQKYDLPIISVIETTHELPYVYDGAHINSPLINGLNKNEAINVLGEYLQSHKLGLKQTFYKLRDWVFSRQRYWGEPFPVLFDPQGKIKLLEDLPVLLPDLDNFHPSGDGQSPLANNHEWLYVEIDGVKYRRETNTMPQWAGSSWYYLAYILKNPDGTYLPLNSSAAYERFQKWLPVDLYIGGQEHAVLHLLYARFWHAFLYDIKVVPTKEPFQKVINQGMILGPNGEKMSKSKGNVINPDEIIASHGADTLRLYEMFMGPLTASLPWSDEGLDGMRKWLDRVYRLYTNANELSVISSIDQLAEEVVYSYHKMVKNVTQALNEYSFNIAISEMMVFVNVLYKHKQINYELLDNLLIMLSCFTPHLTQELYSYNHPDMSVAHQKWPTYNPDKLIQSHISLPIQFNGKLKQTLKVAKDLSLDELQSLIQADPVMQNHLEQVEVLKVIHVPNKIINFVVKPK
ncbi:leucine--tRNA ligase [Ureaplasma miroungigenitalium]|uniref:Leucine--tRNA ligase n=1 Tax=Ureaplasma miroungigenitalium TaxID=1042321 RepID=A0ABT3BM22_9BACT|nr:leucine--tRNA ligase [Ureaplasma miroungigenitalium]MCV3728299.1 leucine--tRNA ligase [Ureaplasma miroungigenitalium]